MSTPRLTRMQAVIIGAYTGYLAGPFDDLHKYIEKIMNRPVLTHELSDPRIKHDITKIVEPAFLSICAEGTPVSDEAAAIQRVRELHKPVDVEPSERVCQECHRAPDGETYLTYNEYPCATIEALDGEVPE